MKIFEMLLQQILGLREIKDQLSRMESVQSAQTATLEEIRAQLIPPEPATQIGLSAGPVVEQP